MRDFYTYKIYWSKKGNKAVFLFPAGFTSLWQYFFIIQWLRFRGVTVVGFSFDWKSIVARFGANDFVALANEVKHDVQLIASSQLKTNSVIVLGASSGSFFSLYVAKTLEVVTGVVLFQPWGKISRLVWSHGKLLPIKTRVLQSGINSFENFDLHVNSVDPQSDLEKIDTKKIIVFTSKNDRVIPDALDMQQLLKKTLVHGIFYESRLGHLFGIISSMTRVSKWKSILDV